MRQKIRRFFSIALAFCIVMGGIPQFEMTVKADVVKTYYADISKGSVSVSADGISYTESDGTSHTKEEYLGENIEIMGNTTEYSIKVDGVEANITLSGVSIDVSSESEISALELANNASMNLILADKTKNVLKSGQYCAGVQVPEGSVIDIHGEGSLAVTGGMGGAGIGSCRNNTGTGGVGTINISGGIITASGGEVAGGAGIGGGSGANGDSGGIVNISGGVVTANGKCASAGIGGGYGGSGNGGSGGEVTISGGTVIANGALYEIMGCGAGIGGAYGGGGAIVNIKGGTVIANGARCDSGCGAGIGEGQWGGEHGKCYISGGSVNVSSMGPTPEVDSMDSTVLCLTTIKLNDVSTCKKISALTARKNSKNYFYGMDDVYTDSEGKIYFWMPEDTKITQVQTSTHKYVCSIITSANDSKSCSTLTSPAVLNSILPQAEITGVENGTIKGAEALGLPAEATLDTNNGKINAIVSWDLEASDYDPEKKQEQTFMVEGMVTLLEGIGNPKSVSLTTSVKVTVCKAKVKELKGVNFLEDITNVANGTAKSESALGLPSKVKLSTDGGEINADVDWDVAESTYDQEKTEEQTFEVKGIVTLPEDVTNPDNVSLEVTINVTVRKAISTDKILESIEELEDIVALQPNTDEEGYALLPKVVILETDKGRVSAEVQWNVDNIDYDPDKSEEQNFTMEGIVILPKGVVNQDDISLEVSMDVTVLEKTSEKKTLKSIASPSEAQKVANGNEKTADGLCLPKTVKVETVDGDEVNVPVTWDTKTCDYDQNETQEQTFDVYGTLNLPYEMDNKDNVSLEISIMVTVLEAPSTDKILESIEELDDIEDVPNGTDKKAFELGLPPKVTLVTNAGNVNAEVKWEVDESDYNPEIPEEQTFEVKGTVILPDDVVNIDDVSLEVSINVTVLEASTKAKNLESIIPSADITDVINGTAKTASALGLPTTVKLMTDDGNVNAKVTWDVNGSSYNSSSSSAQTFVIDGTVTLPSGVLNPSGVSLTTTVKVWVNKASGSGGSSSGGSSKHDSDDDDDDYGSDSITTKERTQPVKIDSELTPSMDNKGNAVITVSDQTVQEAIDKAIGQKTSKNGIAVSLKMENQAETRAVEMVLTKPALEKLSDPKIQELSVETGLMDLHLDSKAMKQIAKDSNGDVEITITPATGLSVEAKSIIGNRTAYNLTLSYTKDGKNAKITKLDKGKVTISIPYKSENEAAGYLYAVCVDSNGNVIKIKDSVYDANSQTLIFNTNQLAVYGVGYTVPAENFSDISNHWAKDSIDYMVGRGLLEGTSESEFSPDAPVTSQMLVEALGKIAGLDTSNQENKEAAYIEWANSNGLMNGLGSVDYGSTITREEMAFIMNRFIQNENLPVTREAINFADSSRIGNNYKDAVMAMQQAGIIMGEKDNRFDPAANATRAEISAMLYRYMKLTITPDTAQGWARNDAGQYQYYKEGSPLSDWQMIDGVKYYFTKDNELASNQWVKIDGKWHYFYANGTQAENTTIDGYAIDENGEMKTV